MICSEIFFQTTQELEYLFFLSREAQFIIPEFNIRLYDKNSESHYFFFLPPKSEYFFQQHWESEYFFRKKTNNHHPHWKLNGPLDKCVYKIFKKSNHRNLTSHFIYIPEEPVITHLFKQIIVCFRLTIDCCFKILHKK